MRLRPVAELDFTIWGRLEDDDDDDRAVASAAAVEGCDTERDFCRAPPPPPPDPVTSGLGVVGSTDSLGVTGRLLGPVLLSTGRGLLGTAPNCSCGPSPEMENFGSGLLPELSRPPWSFLLLCWLSGVFIGFEILLQYFKNETLQAKPSYLTRLTRIWILK